MSFRFLALSVVLVGLSATATVQAQSFPVTLDHAYGQTTISAKPQRIVTWGWAAQDAVIALGEVPVGIPYFAYGGDENGALAWTREGVASLGADFPAILPNTGRDVPFEAIAALEPDLILAVYSGISEADYTTLGAIAPVVAFPKTPWDTPWQQVVTMTGEAMGKKNEAEALVADLEQFIADETARYPELNGATFAAFDEWQGEITVYGDLDSRVKFLVDAGMVSAPVVAELANGHDLYFPLSFENFDKLTADVLITYFETPEDQAAFFADPVLSRHPQARSGSIASIMGADLNSSVSPPSALSLEWGYPQYIKTLADAVRAGRN